MSWQPMYLQYGLRIVLAKLQLLQPSPLELRSQLKRFSSVSGETLDKAKQPSEVSHQ